MTTSPYDNLPTGKSNRMKYGTSVTTDVSKNIPNTESNPHSSASNPADYANSASSNQTEAADPVISNKAESLIQTETPPNPADTSAPSPKTAQKKKNIASNTTETAAESETAQLSVTDKKTTRPSIEKTYVPYEIEDIADTSNHTAPYTESKSASESNPSSKYNASSMLSSASGSPADPPQKSSSSKPSVSSLQQDPSPAGSQNPNGKQDYTPQSAKNNTSLTETGISGNTYTSGAKQNKTRSTAKSYAGSVNTKASSNPGPVIDHTYAAKKTDPNSAQTVPFDSSLKYSKATIKNRIGIREYILPFDDSLLVPDTMPDMKEIFFTEGRAVLSQPGKTAYAKGDTLSGEIIFYTVYHPDGASEPIDVVKSRIPFNTDKCWGENEDSSYRVSVSLKSSDSELINERKFTARGEISIKMTEITKKEINTLEESEDDSFICLKSPVNATGLSFETEEISEISETLKIGEDQPSPAKILKTDINISEAHRQISAGKLIVNAVINSRILYKGTEDGETKICSASGKSDLTQFIPMKTEPDADLIKIDYDISGLEISIENDSGFMLEGQVRTKIQGYKNEEFISVSDAYHKERNVSFETGSKKIFSVPETVFGEISAREVINTEGITDSPDVLLCSSVQSAEISARLENNRIIIQGSLPVKILGLDSDGEPFTTTADVPVRGSLEVSCQLSEDMSADTWFSIKDIWADTINSRQIEINAALSIETWITKSEEFLTIENAVYMPEDPAEQKSSSMNIYVVGKNDTLWNIAKKYKSDEQTIALLNQIDVSLPLPEGMKLFISR